jgi:hypothetical protein
MFPDMLLFKLLRDLPFVQQNMIAGKIPTALQSWRHLETLDLHVRLSLNKMILYNVNMLPGITLFISSLTTLAYGGCSFFSC